MRTSFWRRWWSGGRAGKRGRPVLRQRGLPLQVEQLEDRTLLSGTPLLLADINPGAASSNPSQMVVIGSTTYFVANDGTHGNELWKTDGTTADTLMVADINPGSAGSYPTDLTNVNGTLFFSASDATHGTRLWKSDGTPGGTVPVANVVAQDLTNVNGTLFFACGNSLWKSDGTAAGTVQVSNAVSNPLDLTNVNGELFFSGYDDADGHELWKSDGTAAGTVLVKDIYPGWTGIGYFPYSYTRVPNSSYPSSLTNVNGTLYFAADDANGTELWKSDGTAAGTVLLAKLSPTATTSYATDLTDVNGTLYFRASSPSPYGTLYFNPPGELWKSDGTTAGTVAVPYPISDASDITNINGTLFFAASDGSGGTALWRTNGTTAGTTVVKDFGPSVSHETYFTGSYGTYSQPTYTFTNINNITNVNGELFFTADDGTHGNELWQSDGTAAGTTLVQDIYPGSSWQTVSTRTGYSGGTETGRAYLPNSSNPSFLTNLNGTLLFTANDGTHGDELWEVPAGPSLAVSAASTTPTAGQADTFTVTALKADGTPDTSLSGTVTLTSGDPKAVLPTSVTLAGGTAQFSATFETAGPQLVTATDAQAPTDFGSADVNVQAAAASRFTLTGLPSPIVVGTPGSFTVTAYDTYGNVATGYGGTVAFSSSDPHALLPANTTLTNGIGQFNAALETVGTNESLTARDTQNAALTATQGSIEVVPSVSISGPSAAAIGQRLTFTIGAGADPADTVFTVSWGDGTSIQTTGTTVAHDYTASATDSIRVTASAAGLTSAPAYKPVNVLPVAVAIQADSAKASQQVLVVDGTANADSIVLGSGTDNGVTLSFDGTALGNILPTNGNAFALVLVFGLGGNDIIDARGLAVSSVLVGGSGNDTLYGGGGRNLVIGGLGSDTLHAGSGGDILIGGTTSYDGNLSALEFIMAEWDRTDVIYSTRVKQLSGGMSGGSNGSYVLNGTTVFDDRAVDALYGGAGLDWFFAHTGSQNKDSVYGRTSGEVVTSI